MSRLTQQEAERLARICAMFSSNHAGERSSAAAMADELVRKAGLVWSEVIFSSSSYPSSRSPSGWSTEPSRARPCPQGDCSDLSPEELIDLAVRVYDDAWISPWERKFVMGVCGCRSLTDKQLAKLRSIVAEYLKRRAA